jgi:hypothetical protein
MQHMFNPTDYGWTWTDNGGWYNWDGEAGHKAALQARNAKMKELKAQGYKVKGFSLRDQLISRGGIGSGRAHIETVVTVYGVNVF